LKEKEKIETNLQMEQEKAAQKEALQKKRGCSKI